MAQGVVEYMGFVRVIDGIWSTFELTFFWRC